MKFVFISMKVFIFLLLLTTSVWANNTAPVRIVTLTRGLANAEFQYLAKIQRTPAEDALYTELSSALEPRLPAIQYQLEVAEKNLEAVHPKEFINPFWWPAVQNLRYAQQQLNNYVPPKDSDIVFYYTTD
jgi:hypothetical protein